MRKKLIKMIGALLFLSMILTSVCPLSVFAAEGTTEEVTEEQTTSPSFEQQADKEIELIVSEEATVAVVSAETLSENHLKDEEVLSADTEKSTEVEEQNLLTEEETKREDSDSVQMSFENEATETAKEEKVKEDDLSAEEPEEEQVTTAGMPVLQAGATETEESRIELAITNNTAMFKVVTAYLETNNGKTELIAALSSTGYQNLFLGTYEEAVENGDNRSAWISFFTDENGRYAFRIPITEGKTYYPVVAISQSYLDQYAKGQCSIARAFYPRQFTLDPEAKTLITGDYEFSQPLDITNNVKMFKPEEASLETVGGPNSNTYKAELNLTMGSDSFDKVFVGTAEAAAKAAETIAIKDRIVIIPTKWLKTKGDPESLVSLLENPFITSWHSVSKDAWYERKFTISEKEGTLVIDEVTEEDKQDEEPDDQKPEDNPDDQQSDADKPDDQKTDGEDALDGGTAAVDNSTSLPDGVYTPDSFSFSGGSGRATLSCQQVTVQNGQAFAKIAFSSANYGYVKAAGGIYYPSYEGGVSNFTIPIQLNQNNTIIGMTTAMSAAHEITYTIFVYIAAAEGKDAADVVNNDSIGEADKMDETAPAIIGVSGGEEIELENVEYLKMFRYDNDMVLVEIDRTKDTVLESAEPANESALSDGAEETEEAADATIEDEETGSTQKVKTTADYQMELYQSPVVKYLIVPDGIDLPAGLDKKAIIIRLPKESVYVSSEIAAADLESLGLLDLIKATGVTEDNCKNETLKALLQEKKTVSAGTLTDLNYTELLKAKVDLAIGAGDELFSKKAENGKTAKDYQEQYTKISERLALLDIPLLIDRSADEKDPKGQEEWLKLYGVLFGKEEEADALITKGQN